MPLAFLTVIYNPTDADSGAPAYVRHVWRYHSGADPGKQLFSR